MPANYLYNLLNNKIGLSVSTIGEETVNGIINSFIKEENISSIDYLVNKINDDSLLLNKFLEKFLINETWFLRDQKPFLFLKEYIEENWSIKNKLRILSIPCSSGEEVYSISILLSQIENLNFNIEGIDLSKKALTIAKQGIYRKNAFRGTDEYFQTKYFNKIEDNYFIKDEYKNNIKFYEGNILDGSLLSNEEQYDIIFCRNLLIYFDEEKRLKAKNKIDNLLKDNGLLFVGHAETMLFNSTYSLMKEKSSFVLQRKNADIVNNNIKLNSNTIKPKKQFEKIKLIPQIINKDLFQPKTNGTKKEINNSPSMENAKGLADTAKYEEALLICNEHEKLNGPTFENYNLQGIIYSALKKQNDAIDKFKKAIYLNPNDYESLLHLALIYKKTGNEKQATQLIIRSNRIKEKNEA